MNITVTALHRMPSSIPLVEITDNADTDSLWRPYSKPDTFYPLNHHRMGTENFINFIMNAGLKLLNIFNLDRCRKSVRVPTFYCVIFSISYTIMINGNRFFRKQNSKIILIYFPHLHSFLSFHKNLTLFCPWKIGLYKNTLIHLMGA